MTSYRQYLERAGVTNVSTHLERSQQALQRLQSMRADFFRLALSTFRAVGGCYMKIYHYDEKVRLELLLREEAYLRQVHKEIGRLRDGEVSTQFLKKEYGFKNLPSNFVGLDEFSAEGYRYSKVDVLIRMAQNLTKGMSLGGRTWPALAPHMTINYGAQLSIENNLVGNKEGKVENRGDLVFLPYLPNQDDFVAQAMVLLLQGTEFVNWYSASDSRLLNSESRLHAAAILYRLSDSKILEEVCRPPMQCAAADSLVGGQELIDMHEQMLAGLRIEGEERRLMNLVRLPRKVGAMSLSRKMVEYDFERHAIKRVWGLYDLPMRLMSKPLLGASAYLQELAAASGKDNFMMSFSIVEGYKHYSYLRMGKLYWQLRTREERKLFILPVSSSLDAVLDKMIFGFIKSETKKMHDFSRLLADHIKGLERLPEKQRPFVDISVEERVTDMITPSTMNDLDAQRRLFERATNFCYTEQGCQDFM